GIHLRQGQLALACAEDGSAMGRAALMAATDSGMQMAPVASQATGQEAGPCSSNSHGNTAPVSSMPSPPPLKNTTIARVPITPASTPPQINVPAPPKPAKNRNMLSQRKSRVSPHASTDSVVRTMPHINNRRFPKPATK